jgi:hypothetical protein
MYPKNENPEDLNFCSQAVLYCLTHHAVKPPKITGLLSKNRKYKIEPPHKKKDGVIPYKHWVFMKKKVDKKHII